MAVTSFTPLKMQFKASPPPSHFTPQSSDRFFKTPQAFTPAHSPSQPNPVQFKGGEGFALFMITSVLVSACGATMLATGLDNAPYEGKALIASAQQFSEQCQQIRDNPLLTTEQRTDQTAALFDAMVRQMGDQGGADVIKTLKAHNPSDLPDKEDLLEKYCQKSSTVHTQANLQEFADDISTNVVAKFGNPQVADQFKHGIEQLITQWNFEAERGINHPVPFWISAALAVTFIVGALLLWFRS